MAKFKGLKKRTKLFLCILLVFLAVFLYGFRFDLKVVNYNVESENVTAPVRLAVLGDLHSCLFGENQSKLVKMIEKQNPDAILMVGDIFDNEIPDDNTELLMQQIGNKYPCYYVTGNHEFWSGKKAFEKKMAILKKYGVNRLCGDVETVKINGQKINICGVDDPDVYKIYPDEDFTTQLDKAQNQTDTKIFSVLLAHRPEQMPVYKNYNFDLTVCGHAHGGQWRIPFVLNGVYTPYEGKFPKYAGGYYDEDGTKMIVTRGLATNEIIPRYYNRTELVIITIE